MQDLLFFYILFNITKNNTYLYVDKLPDPQPVINIDKSYISFEGQSILVADTNNKKYFEKNILQKLPIASLTKIMSAIIAIENINPDEYITIKNKPTVEGYTPTLKVGDIFQIRDLLIMSLVSSDNDAIYAIADYYGYQKFIELMNKKAKTLKMYNTHFTNPVGYDDEMHYSNAIDILTLSKYALKYKLFSDIVNMDQYNIKSKNGNIYKDTNTNKLFINNDIKNFIYGIKTGTTKNAKECLVFLYKKKDINIIGIILGSQNRYKDAMQVISLIHSKI